MTINISFALTDGYLTSSSTNYTTAQSGNGIIANTTGALIRYGQNKVGSTYELYEAFFHFPYTLDANAVRVAAYFEFYQESTLGTGTARDMGIRGAVWLSTLDSADWRAPATIGGLERLGVAGDVHAASAKRVYASEYTLNDQLAINGDLQLIMYSSRFTGSNVPAAAEYSNIRSAETSGTSTDPKLVWTTVPANTLVRVGGAQVQLSDGRHAFLESTTGGSNPVVALKYHDGTTSATIDANALVAEGFGDSNAGMQSVDLVRDGTDNLYILAHTAGAGNTLSALCYEKTGASTWTKRTRLFADMPVNSGVINNLSAAWHNVGTEGTIMVVGSHETNGAHPSPVNQMFYALLNCFNLRNGTGPLLRGSGDAYPTLVASTFSSGDHNAFLNEAGSSLEVVALPDTDARGVVVSQTRDATLGDYAPVSIVRYTLHSTGTYIWNDEGGDINIDLWGTKDAGAKVRVLPVSMSVFAVVTVDRDSGWGPMIRVIQNIGDSATFSQLGGVQLHGETIASLPLPSTMDTSFAWDAIYQPDSNMIWVYYFDTANAQRLMRTGFDLTTYKANKAEIQVSAAVAAAGTFNHAIRVQRGRLTESEVLVTVANKTSGQVQSNIYIVDRLNVAPTAPTLIPKANYDATTGAVFDWTFNDPNVGDTQTAYEFQVDNADTLASVVATGKITSTTSDRNVTGGTLSNGVNYRWRVRTWDTSDSTGAWSSYDFFTTSAGGSVNITDPATDNPAGVITDNYTVTWTATGTTQTAYKIRVVNNVTGAVLLDTGWVTSTATSREILNMVSDVEYRIEVTVRNSALVETNTATRLLTPNYNEPEIPEISVVTVPDQGHILISVTNPTPQGDRPQVTVNRVNRRVVGASSWSAIADIGHGGSYADYHVASGVEYEYMVTGIGSIGTSDSATTQVTLELLGVWLHLPLDPSNTRLNLMYGKNQRSGSHQSYAALTRFAGRENPVADFAHYHDQTFSVTVDVPFGDEWAPTIAKLYELESSHQVVAFRDNRRRFQFCILTGLTEQDTDWGSQLSFDVTKVDFNESVI